MISRFHSLLLAAAGAAVLVPSAASAQGNSGPGAPQSGSVAKPRTIVGYVPGALGIPQPEPKVTVNFTGLSLARSLNEILKQSGYSVRVLAEMGTTRYSLTTQAMPVSKALRALLDQDKSLEPLVFRFQRILTGGGEFIIDRELIDVSRSEGENRVSLANARITKVLPMVAKMLNAPLRFEPDVPPILVSMQLRPSDWAPVVQQVVLEAYKQEPAITYSMDGNTYVIHLQKTPLTGVPGMPSRKVKVSADSKPLREVLQSLFEGSAWKFQVAESVKDTKITYNVSNEPELVALHAILRQTAESGTPITYREGPGILFVEPGLLPGDFFVPKVKPGDPAALNLVTLDVRGTRLKELLEKLAIQSAATIIMAPNVPNLPVTMKVEKVTLDVALQEVKRALNKQLPNLLWSKDGTEYIVSVK